MDTDGGKYMRTKTKTKADLKKHQANVHDIGVVWHSCDAPGCEYKAKLKCNLTKHQRTQH